MAKSRSLTLPLSEENLSTGEYCCICYHLLLASTLLAFKPDVAHCSLDNIRLVWLLTYGGDHLDHTLRTSRNVGLNGPVAHCSFVYACLLYHCKGVILC